MAISIKTIKGKQYVYEHWREGNKIKTKYIGPLNKIGLERVKELKGDGEKKVNEAVEREILEAYEKAGYGYTKTAQYIEDKYNIKISRATVRNIVKKAGIKRVSTAKKRELIEEYKKKIKELEWELKKKEIELESYKEVYG